MLAQCTFFNGGAKNMARLQEEGAEANFLGGSPTAETRAFNLGTYLQPFLTHLILLLSLGLFSRHQWGPALIVLAVYVLTLVAVFSKNDDR
jgi:hypothetical protein